MPLSYDVWIVDRCGEVQHIYFDLYARYIRFKRDCRHDGVRIVRDEIRRSA